MSSPSARFERENRNTVKYPNRKNVVVEKLRAIVTGGVGFIGSHLVDSLLIQGYQVKVIDNLTSGNIENLEQRIEKGEIVFANTDLRDRQKVFKEIRDTDVVFHLAADPDVRTSISNPLSHYENNVLSTLNVLESLRVNKIQQLVFTSSSTVYGDAKLLPTPEDGSSLMPISIYGASKLACEALISGYAHTHNVRTLVLRPANIIGSRATHGVIFDFINKLITSPQELEILGDGSQRKSYLYISDFIDALMKAYSYFKKNGSPLETYNVGNNNSTSVLDIANMVVEEMELKDVSFNLTGGIDGGRGWKGDVKNMQLCIKKLKCIGWMPHFNSEEAVRLTIRDLLR